MGYRFSDVRHYSNDVRHYLKDIRHCFGDKYCRKKQMPKGDTKMPYRPRDMASFLSKAASRLPASPYAFISSRSVCGKVCRQPNNICLLL